MSTEKEFKAKKPDYKAGTAKQRKKINDLVEQRKSETGGDEAEVRKEIMKELRAARKEKKMSAKNEVKNIEKSIKREMAGQPEGVVLKAVRAAVAQFHSKKKKHSKNEAGIKAVKIMTKKIAEKWCPRDEKWFDKECIQSYDSLYLLGAMMDINIEKNTDNFEALFPKECSKHIDLLAKKRFNCKWEAGPEKKTEGVAEKEGEAKKQDTKKKKSKLEKALNEKLKNNPEKLSEQQILNNLVKQIKDTENQRRVKGMRKIWFPVNQAWFDQECKEYAEKIKDKATDLGLDLKTTPADFKKLKTKAKELTKNYLILLESKKKGHNREEEKELKTKNKNKKKKKTKAEPQEEEVEEEVERENKKIKFDDDVDEEVEEEGDDTVEDFLMEEETPKADSEKRSKKKSKKNKKKDPLTPKKEEKTSPKKTDKKTPKSEKQVKETPQKTPKSKNKENKSPTSSVKKQKKV